MNPVYNTPEWHSLRGRVITASGYTCHICGGIAESAHHVSYKKGIICPPRWLRALCWRCHRMVDGIGVLERSNLRNG